MQRSAEGAILMAIRPMERTALRTKSISTSDAYLFKPGRLVSMRKKHGRRNALFQFGENLFDIPLVGEAIDDFELGKLDVDRVVVLAEEDFDVVP